MSWTSRPRVELSGPSCHLGRDVQAPNNTKHLETKSFPCSSIVKCSAPRRSFVPFVPRRRFVPFVPRRRFVCRLCRAAPQVRAVCAAPQVCTYGRRRFLCRLCRAAGFCAVCAAPQVPVPFVPRRRFVLMGYRTKQF